MVVEKVYQFFEKYNFMDKKYAAWNVFSSLVLWFTLRMI